MSKRSLTRIAALIAGIWLSAAPALAAQALERLFYYVDREDSYQSLVKNIDQITILGPQVYTVDSLGVVFGELDSRVLALAKAHRVKVMPLVVNEAFNQPALRKLLADTAARRRATRGLLQLCQQNGYWGIQFDIENVNIADRDLLTSWYRETASALHRGGFTLSIAVVHQTEENAGPTAYHRFLQDSWSAGYDLAALAQAGDFISLMTYSENARSFREKLNLVRTFRLRGFSVWVLGPEDPAIWDILRSEPKS